LNKSIYSTGYAFATLKADGSITAWGSSGAGGTGAPSGSRYTKIYSTEGAFAALKADDHHQRVHLCRQHVEYPTP
jgi:hypothetical protein